MELCTCLNSEESYVPDQKKFECYVPMLRMNLQHACSDVARSRGCMHLFCMISGVRVLVAPSGKSVLLVVNPLSLLFVTTPRMDPQFSQGAASLQLQCLHV